jgi:EAL domain-containing protein (putative c-di-GMP-specific phosphodiesterase class I)
MAVAAPCTLFVDDDADVLVGIRDALRRRRLSILTASSGVEALSIIDRETVAVVVSDERMPEMTGTQLLSHIRQRHPDIIRMVLSGTTDVRAITQAVNLAGVFRYLLKPCTPADLTLAVEQALEAHALQLGSNPPRGIGLNIDAALAGLHMVVQPIYETRGGRLLAHEALLRCTGEPGVAAEDLLDAGLRSGRLWEVERMIRGLIAAKMAARPLDTAIFVNVHPHSLLDPQLYSDDDPLAAHAEAVVIEITERSSLASVKDLAARLDALRRRGYRIAVDDMGSGYAGFTAFAIRPDFVKFDRTLIQGARTAQAERRLVTSIASVCADLGIATIAEGIEGLTDYQAAAAMGCTHVQGFFLARPEMDFRRGPFQLIGR